MTISQFIINDRRKQHIIDIIIKGFIHYMQNLAELGKTSYTYDRCGVTPIITNDDLVAAFQKRFPHCNISYHEDLVNVSLFKKIFKKTIVIDWSQ